MSDTWKYIKLRGPVGKNGLNDSDDVMTVQSRLNHWIYKGLVPQIDYLEVDGDCGAKTKLAIGAFQFKVMGIAKPDCRVDPGGQTLQAMYQSLITPLTSEEEKYAKWLLEQENPPAAKTKKQPKWIVTDEDLDKISSAWGPELAAWASIAPADDAESKEFHPPSFLRDKYETVFAWKSAVPTQRCAASPRDRLHVLGMVRSDHSYWASKMGDNQIGIEMLKTATASAIRDYRLYVIEREYCPAAAKLTLQQINKDVLYQMFLGMFQLLSPTGAAPSAFANHSGAVAGFVKAVISWQQDPEKKPIYKHF